MSTWKCSECGATGQQPNAKAARREFEHHWLVTHNEIDW